MKLRRMRWAGKVARMGRGKGRRRFSCGDLRERDHFEDLGIDGRIILKWIFKTWVEGMDWIDMAQTRDRWRTLVNAVMNNMWAVSWHAEDMFGFGTRILLCGVY
jgi:hypothetical protein